MDIHSAPTILIADDQAMMRDGIVLMIQTAWPQAVCKIASDYQGVIEQLDGQTTHMPFDAIILDLRMPGMRGAESVSTITQRAAGTAVIVCTALEDPSLLDRLVTSGVYRTVNKAAGADALLGHVRDAFSSSRQATLNINKDNINKNNINKDNINHSHNDSNNNNNSISYTAGCTHKGVNGNASVARHLQAGSAMLTTRQREILAMLHTGKPSKVIASQMGLGLGTIKSHLHTLYSVMGVSNRSEAIVKSQGWLL